MRTTGTAQNSRERGKLRRAAALLGAVVLSAAAGAQELTIDFRYHLTRDDGGNYLTFKTSNRFIAADKDAYDGATGASRKNATELFGAVYLDMGGKTTFPEGLRGVLLFPLAAQSLRDGDAFHAARGSGGEITVEYVHYGVAYRMVTDKQGRLSLPRGNMRMRTVGSVDASGAQVISREFSDDGTVTGVNWKKVWDDGMSAATGPVRNDYGSLDAMFNWDGYLTVGLEGEVLTIAGTLRLAKR